MAPKIQPETAEVAPRADTLFVVDTTAKRGPRTHEIEIRGMLQALVFEPGKPRELPFYVAAKFLRHEGFIRTDAQGNRLEWEGIPKQPGELQAGERLVLTASQTVATLSELTMAALVRRAILLPKGDELATRPNVTREQLAAFIETETARIAEANKRPEDGIDDGYTPPPLAGMDEAA